MKLHFMLWTVLLVAIDVLSKTWLFDNSNHVWNAGIFLGMFDSWWWVVAPIFVFGVLIVEFHRAESNWYRYALVLMLAGGIGNWLDRIRFGAVRDFIYYPVIGVWGNVADIYISAAFILVIYMFMREWRHTRL